tara:strand:+ start:36 stop:206 length:171 start_codon:yes stop_codon:yes gene_type:complete
MDLNTKEIEIELKKIQRMNVNHPSYPSFRKMIMDMSSLINLVIAEILKKEDKYTLD